MGDNKEIVPPQEVLNLAVQAVFLSIRVSYNNVIVL